MKKLCLLPRMEPFSTARSCLFSGLELVEIFAFISPKLWASCPCTTHNNRGHAEHVCRVL